MAKRATYSQSIRQFLTEDERLIFGMISNDFSSTEEAQKSAWLHQIRNLKDQLEDFSRGEIFFEFIIPRMGKRADVILYIEGIIFVLEYKVGSSSFDKHAIDQTLDYAYDLKCFHEGSHSKVIVPILIATDSKSRLYTTKIGNDLVADIILTNGLDLAENIQKVLSNFPNKDVPNTGFSDGEQEEYSAEFWASSGYKPTPTIIEAAQALYSNHLVEEISRSDADAKNLTLTTDCISKIINFSKEKKRKSICFITGVPGAGKTLVGLNIATQQFNSKVGTHATFLSGNGPLVAVLREALTRDEVVRSKSKKIKMKKGDAERRVKAFVQNVHHFRDEGLANSNPPEQNVVVFDEAQRAWNREETSKFVKRKKGLADFNMSEPEFLISLMDRRDDWCTIVCLIGGGQEINKGEAGLIEWFDALKEHFKSWDIYHSGHLGNETYNWGMDLQQKLSGLNVFEEPDLHLSVSMRSFRAEKLSDFIGAVLEGNSQLAIENIKYLDKYPLVVTRDIQKARYWLREKAKGTQRLGLVASSGAIRLKPEGITVKAKIEPENWFLNGKEDVRSSYYLEDVATEFDIQGLELDWVGVCWDADLRYEKNSWKTYNFSGTAWQNIKDSYRKVYKKNAYRVLLTRARQGMVIFVPQGDDLDHTRPKNFYDGAFDFLKLCGIEEL